MNIESQRNQWPHRVAALRVAALGYEEELWGPIGYQVNPDGSLNDGYAKDGHDRFSPTAVNPPSSSSARPKVTWKRDEGAHPSLDLGLNDHIEFKEDEHSPALYRLPLDRHPVKLYRGLSMDLYNPEIRRALFGNEREEGNNKPDYIAPDHPILPGMPNDDEIASPTHAWGKPNPELAHKILDNLVYGGGHTLGTHWTISPSEAKQWANANYNAYSDYHPIMVEADWYGHGEDPYRMDTEGNHPDEKEMTLLPGAPLQIRNLHIQHPETGAWHPMLPDPQTRHASRTAIINPQDGDEFERDPHGGQSSTPKNLKSPLYDENTRLKLPNLTDYMDSGGPQYHFSPREVNPEANTSARPATPWYQTSTDDPIIPGMGLSHNEGEEWEYGNERQPYDLHRGFKLWLPDYDGNSSIAQARRILHGDYFENANQHNPDHLPGSYNDWELARESGGFDHPDLPHHILNHILNSHDQQELGTHWSTDFDTAGKFAGVTPNKSMYMPQSLPVVVSGQWKGVGEDPYRRHAEGDFSDEHEITLLPGAPMKIHTVRIHNPYTDRWHTHTLDEPQERTAATILRKVSR